MFASTLSATQQRNSVRCDRSVTTLLRIWFAGGADLKDHEDPDVANDVQACGTVYKHDVWQNTDCC